MIEALEDMIFENNTVCIFGVIDESMTKNILKQILALQVKFRKECIVNPCVVVFINSPGGAVSCGLAIYDSLKALNCKVVTVCLGQAASMAAVLLSSGTKRYVSSNSEIMIHQVLGEGIHGQASDVEIACNHILKIKTQVNHILSENTGKTVLQIESDGERDFYMSPIEASNYGLVDKIFTNFAEVYDELLYQ